MHKHHCRSRLYHLSVDFKSIIPNFDFFHILLLSLAILKYRRYFLMLQTLKLNNKKGKKIFVSQGKKFGRIDSWSWLSLITKNFWRFFCSSNCSYSVFHRFGQAKFAYCVRLPKNMVLSSKVVKMDSKLIISLPWYKSVKLNVLLEKLIFRYNWYEQKIIKKYVISFLLHLK